jgi:Macrocin-O-methyltransferase (TylF)
LTVVRTPRNWSEELFRGTAEESASFMKRSMKQHLLRLIQRAGYVVTKVADYNRRDEFIAQLENDLQIVQTALDQELAEERDRARAAALEFSSQLAEERDRARVAALEFSSQLAEERDRARAAALEFSIRLDDERARAAWQFSEADREFRLGRERDARELEASRAETWAIREAKRELHDRLAQTLDENRRLKIRLEEAPEIDYQVLMREQHERAAFQDADPAFTALYERVKNFSMTSIERLYAMYKATEYVCRAGVPGSIVECGVWRGGSMMMAALTLQALGDTSRNLYLFDTFAGLPKPNASEDVDLWGHSAYNEWTRHRLTDESSDWAAASIEEVRANLAATGYPSEKLIFVKGMVQQTLPTAAVDRIALLRLDTDRYESTVCELESLYPRVVDNGILIIDDYGHMRGQRKAVDEYFARNQPFLLLNRIDYSGRVGVKPALRDDSLADGHAREL